MRLAVLATLHDRKAILALVILLWVAEWASGMTHEIRLGAEAGAVVEPIALHRGGGEVFLLLLECLLLAVRAVERVDAREELLGDRLRDVPRRISEDCVKAGARLAEYVRKLELPVEEAHLGCDPVGYGPRLVRGLGECARERGAVDLVRRPEPAGAPEVHPALERAPCRRPEEALPVGPRPLRRVLHGQGVHLPEHGEGIIVRGERLFEQVLLKQSS